MRHNPSNELVVTRLRGSAAPHTPSVMFTVTVNLFSAPCVEFLTLDISVCLAGLARCWVKGGSLESVEGLRASDTSASVRPALGYWVKEGVGLVVHFSLEDVAKINTP
jgi:hypothetical protein